MGRTLTRLKPGDKNGRLVALRPDTERVSLAHPRWIFRCDCGVTKSVVAHSVVRELDPVKSCGCLAREVSSRLKKSHGMSQAKGAYTAWTSMRARCGPSHKDAHYYHDRGITIDPRWDTFDAFLEDMGPRPSGTTIDRIDNNRGYGPGNCRWATAAQQNRNTRANVWLTHDGRTQCLSDWAKELGLSKVTLRGRLLAGWSHARALSLKSRGARVYTVRIGDRFGMLTIVAPMPRANNHVVWSVQCDCGTVKPVRESNLTSARGTKSCGCKSVELKAETMRRMGPSRSARRQAKTRPGLAREVAA